MNGRTTPLTRPSRSRAEWVSFAVASTILLAVAVTIGVIWAQPSRPPEIAVTMVGEPRPAGSSVYVTAEVANSGTETAEDVQILAQLTEAGEPLQVGEQAVAFLAGGATEQVVFVIDASFDLSSLALSVQSYRSS